MLRSGNCVQVTNDMNAIHFVLAMPRLAVELGTAAFIFLYFLFLYVHIISDHKIIY